MSVRKKMVTTPKETEKKAGEKSAQDEARLVGTPVLNGEVGMAILRNDRSVAFVAHEGGNPIVIDGHWAVFKNLPDDDREMLKACSTIAEFIIRHRAGEALIACPEEKYCDLPGPEIDWAFWVIVSWRCGENNIDPFDDSY